MMYPVPFRAAHFATLELQDAQAWFSDYATDAGVRALEQHVDSTTLMLDGKPIVCCGAIPYWDHRAMVWSFLSARIDRTLFRQVHSYAKTFLGGLRYRRLEAAVDVGFDPGHRWVRSLGFKQEAPVMRGFMFDGRDCALYARVREA